jgi:L-alanine-DL-glutamate epimerase-like enolase superfamily enzyme
VSSDDLQGLAELRAALPLDITAGEYGDDLVYFEHMLKSGAVDVLQADVGRCAGITEWLRVAAASAAHPTPFSAHCGQSLQAYVACVPPNLRHIEYFHDHTRIDQIMFDRALAPIDSSLRPAGDRPGLELTLRCADPEPHRVA